MAFPLGEGSRQTWRGRQRGFRSRVALPTIVWWGPHVVIWSTAMAYVWSALHQTGCVGLCGVYQGLLAYSAISLACVLSAVVGIVQLAILTFYTRFRSRQT